MDNFYLLEKVNTLRREELLREVAQREQYKQWSSGRLRVPRVASLLALARRMLGWIAPRGQVSLSK